MHLTSLNILILLKRTIKKEPRIKVLYSIRYSRTSGSGRNE